MGRVALGECSPFSPRRGRSLVYGTLGLTYMPPLTHIVEYTDIAIIATAGGILDGVKSYYDNEIYLENLFEII